MLSFTILLLSISIPFISSSENGDLCGLKEPEKDKTCISLRLPFTDKNEPIFFCTEKENLKFKSRENYYSSYCFGSDEPTNLVIGVPWQSCPIVSTPDPCAKVKCPEMPFNRTCKAIESAHLRSAYECCPKYFCEGDVEPDQCHLKRLQGSCQKPKDKNCVAFHDSYGCCAKFQCEGEEKKGMCPMAYKAKKLHSIMSNSTDGNTANTPKIISSNDRLMTSISCVGDYNCHGEMKCCSGDLRVYTHHSSSNLIGIYGGVGSDIAHGYCVEPILEE